MAFASVIGSRSCFGCVRLASDLGPDFEAKAKAATNPHLAIEALRATLNEESARATRNNVVRQRDVSERITKLMNQYTNQQITSAEVIAELIEMAKEVAAEGNRGKRFTPALSAGSHHHGVRADGDDGTSVRRTEGSSRRSRTRRIGLAPRSVTTNSCRTCAVGWFLQDRVDDVSAALGCFGWRLCSRDMCDRGCCGRIRVSGRCLWWLLSQGGRCRGGGVPVRRGRACRRSIPVMCTLMTSPI
ncbi:DUF3387 domain-containing protein [Gordonia sp. ABSL11-1]|uniref:type I restriction enzyme endonuclease domain-containing protein n=1 Tax=Gordonia sp. ABSL11-1 TaxID=3053924 RepID=UPI002573A6AB|nr:type I restriction enzyme endonuclease domain-containing protein [Gordonia sp. ABSL11-1]MDL9947379.1 DUF3387 domain-containing protein [Gordonia sp. ABSL11-1]